MCDKSFPFVMSWLIGNNKCYLLPKTRICHTVDILTVDKNKWTYPKPTNGTGCRDNRPCFWICNNLLNCWKPIGHVDNWWLLGFLYITNRGRTPTIRTSLTGYSLSMGRAQRNIWSTNRSSDQMVLVLPQADITSSSCNS